MVEVSIPFLVLLLPRFERQILLRRKELLDVSLGQNSHRCEQSPMVERCFDTEGRQGIQCWTAYIQSSSKRAALSNLRRQAMMRVSSIDVALSRWNVRSSSMCMPAAFSCVAFQVISYDRIDETIKDHPSG